MADKISDAEARRARMQCILAAVVFLACGAGLALLPLGFSGVVRGALAVFHVIVALAVWLYARRFGRES